MSGRGQHYIPCFLQAGFNSRPGGKVRRAWLYRKGASKPVETALTNIGKERDFYQATVGGITLSADEVMTQAEGAWLSGLVHELRNGKAGPVGNADSIAELFAHVQLRTRAAWFFAEISAESFGRLIQEDAAIQGIVKNLIPSIVEALGDCFSHLITRVAPDVDPEYIRQNLPGVLAGAPISEIFAPGQGRAGDIYNDLAVDVMKMLKVWIMATMAQHPESAPEFRGCAFVICDFPDIRLVQGDTVVVYHKVSGGFTPMLREGEVFDFAFLPLTSSRVVVASKGGTPESGEMLQDASIRCSWNHFISDIRDERLATSASMIGEDIPEICGEDMKKILLAASMDEQRANCRAFLESAAYRAISEKWVPWPWLRDASVENEQGDGA